MNLGLTRGFCAVFLVHFWEQSEDFLFEIKYWVIYLPQTSATDKEEQKIYEDTMCDWSPDQVCV